MDYLQHHGIEGQRWGKRNGPPYPLSRSRMSAKEKARNPRTMTDDELRSAINRKRLENQYSSLSSRTGKYGKINSGISIAKKGLNLVGKSANTASNIYKLKGSTKKEAIDNIENLSKKEKKALKKAIPEYKNEKRAAIISNTSNLSEKALDIKVKPKVNFSEMSDAELKKAIDRMILEENYNDLYGLNKGKDYTEQVISDVGDAVSVLGSAVSIAMLIKELKE